MKHVAPSDKDLFSEDQEYRDASLKTMKTRRWFYIASLIVLCGVILYFTGIALEVLSIPVGIVVWTIVFVFCLRGVVDFLEKHGIKRGFGTFIAYFLFFVVLALCVVLATSPFFGVGQQFENLIQSIPSYIDQIRNWFNGVYAQYADVLQQANVKEYIDSAFASLGNWASSIASSSAQGVVNFGSGVANTLICVGFALVVAYWLLMELPGITRELNRIVSDKHREDLLMLEITFTRVLGGYIRATLIQCAIIGVVCGIGFAVMGIPSAAALGLITGILNIIPVVGPWLGGILAGITGIFVSPLVMVIAVVFTVVVQQVVYTFISPKLMSTNVDVHPAIVILALMLGSSIGAAMSGLIGGLLGMLAAIPLAAASKSIFVYYYEKRTGRAILSPKGVFFKGKSHGVADPLADATGEMSPVPPDLGL